MKVKARLSGWLVAGALAQVRALGSGGAWRLPAATCRQSLHTSAGCPPEGWVSCQGQRLCLRLCQDLSRRKGGPAAAAQ